MRFIVLLKHKIIQLDNIIPLLMELKKCSLLYGPLFVAPDVYTYEVIKKNVVLFDAIKSMGGELRYVNRFKNRLIRLIHNLFILKDYLYKKVVTFQTFDNLSHVQSFLLFFNKRTLKGKRFYVSFSNLPYKSACIANRKNSTIQCNLDVRTMKFEGFDALLFSFTKEQVEKANRILIASNDRFLRIGYTRGMAEWQKFLANSRYSPLSTEEKTPYIFFVLSLLEHAVIGEDNPPRKVLLEECLLVLKEFCKDIHTVFKPSAVTEMDTFTRLINEVGYKNYTISYDHPICLAKNAKLTMAYTPTGVLYDAYFIGCPTVEYAHYDSRVIEMTGGKSLTGDIVDYFVCRDMNKLRAVLKKLIYNYVKVERNGAKLREYFPVLTNQEIKDIFNHIL